MCNEIKVFADTKMLLQYNFTISIFPERLHRNLKAELSRNAVKPKYNIMPLLVRYIHNLSGHSLLNSRWSFGKTKKSKTNFYSIDFLLILFPLC